MEKTVMINFLWEVVICVVLIDRPLVVRCFFPCCSPAIRAMRRYVTGLSVLSILPHTRSMLSMSCRQEL